MNELFRLDGRVAIVTGGAGRLGSAIGRALAEAGAQVVLAGRDAQALEQAASQLGEAVVKQVDVADEASIESLFSEVEGSEGRVDILVNNAGVASRSRLGDATRADFDAVLAVNVTGTYLCAQRAARTMRERGGGKIVNVGSIYANVGGDRRLYEDAPDMVQLSPVYAASKSALVNLTRDLAVQLAPWNIQVNLLSPGGVEADQPESFKRRYSARTPAGRMGAPEDMAGTAVYLASRASDYVTGQQVMVDGGFTAW